MNSSLPQRQYRPYTFKMPSQIQFGEGQSEQLDQHPLVKKHPRLAIITDVGLSQTPYFEATSASLGDAVVFIDTGTIPDSDVVHINALAKRVTEKQIDMLIAIGGGSVMDTAKCVAVVAQKGGTIQEHEGYQRIQTPLMPLLCIPTTAGTGAESTQFAVIKDHHANKKLVYVDESLIPAASILDPIWLKSLPRSVKLATGIDALTHAVEAIASKLCNPYGEAWALRAVEMIINQGALIRFLRNPEDKDAAVQMMTAAHLAGQAISTCMLGACHAMAHALGALHGTSHGIANGLCLTTVMKLNEQKAQTAYAQLGWTLGGKGDVAALSQYAIERISSFIHKEVGVPAKLSEIGVNEGHLAALAKEAFADMDLMTNPVRLKSEEELNALFTSLL
jgi:alcohol dehydrogenase